MISFSPSFFDARISGRMVFDGISDRKVGADGAVFEIPGRAAKGEKVLRRIVDSCMVFLSDGG